MNNVVNLPGNALNGLSPNRMGDITLKQIRGFLAASACSTFSRAATKVFLSQPAFSRVIQEIEAAVGEALFIRSSQGASLSDAGKAFLPHAQRLMA